MRNASTVLVAAGLLVMGCKGSDSSSATPSSSASTTVAVAPKSDTVSLNGAGATFPFPLYSKWISEFGKANPQVKVNYQSVGSGAGIKQITDQTVDFGASDAPMSDEELAKAKGKLHHVPMTLGAVVVTYNLPDAKAAIKLTPEALTGVFMGEIKKWNDPKLVADNPDAKLPATNITVVARSDGSGTTAVFTDYLAKVSPAWKDKVGAGKSVKWPAGISSKGNEGVTGSVKSTPGSIGYVELAYAKQNNLATASLKNQAGKFTDAALASVTAAAASVADKMPDDLRVSITNAPGEAAYPIAAFSYVLVYEQNANAQTGQALANYLWWGLHEGQEHAEALHYGKLPAPVVAKAEAKVKLLKAEGKALLVGK